MTHTRTDRHGEEGYLLLGLVVVCFLLLLALAVAAPRVAKELERDREVESEHRALEYVRAIQLYYRKNGAYPTSVEQLLGAGMAGAVAGPAQVKYLRQAYKDPLTNDEYRLIHQNEAQTQVKGFFGAPLTGVLPGVGGTPSAAAAIGGSTPGTAVNAGGAGSTGGGFSLGTSSFGSQGSSASGAGTAASTSGGTGTVTGAASGTGTAGTSGTSSSTDATTFQGAKGVVVGVGSNAKGHGLVEWNGSEDIDKWEFLYDPRVEQMKAQVSLFGGTPAQTGSGSLGGGFAPISGTSTPGSSVAPAGGGITGSSTPGSLPGAGTSGAGTAPTTPTQ